MRALAEPRPAAVGKSCETGRKKSRKKYISWGKTATYLVQSRRDSTRTRVRPFARACFHTENSCRTHPASRKKKNLSLAQKRQFLNPSSPALSGWDHFSRDQSVPEYNERLHQVLSCLRKILFELGFLSSVSYIKPIPTHHKNYLLWEKVAQLPLLTHFFLGWVGLGLGSSSAS